jgi:S1-C subfamily serine protease
MEKPVPSAGSSSREVRLLLVTVAVSLAVLFVLSQFRFPERPAPAEPAPVPLERLAARATYDELASIIATLQERLRPALVTLEAETVEWPGTRRWLPGVRIQPDLAVALIRPNERIVAVGGTVQQAVAIDPLRHLALLKVEPHAEFLEGPLWVNSTPPTEPRYIAVAEAVPGGPALRPLFVGRSQAVPDSRWERPTYVLAAATAPPAASSALFTLSGRLLGLIAESNGAPVLVTGEAIAAATNRLLQGTASAPAQLGVRVQALDRSLSAATGASRGVVVAYVDPAGPAARALQIGDVVTAVNTRPVATPDDLAMLLSETPPGEVSVEFVRDGEVSTVALSTAAPTSGHAGAGAGWTLRIVSGVGSEVLHVRAGSATSRAGLRRGDVITMIGGQAAPTPAQADRAFSRLSAGGRLLIGLERNDQHLVVALEKR